MEYLKQQLAHLVQLHQVLNKKLESCQSAVMGHLVDDVPLPWPAQLEEAVATQRATLEKLSEIDRRLDQLPLEQLQTLEQRLVVGLDHVFDRLDAIDLKIKRQTEAIRATQLEDMLAQQTPLAAD